MKPRSAETISYTMSQIRGKDTGIEILLRKALWAHGVKGRHNSKYIFGHPDLSWKGYKVVVFCDSEFWHGYHFEEQEKKIHSHQEYWIPKIERNIARDEEVNAELTKEGYTILRFWGNEITQDAESCAKKILAVLQKKGYPSIH
jgi:DNA mismatch endonuclease (patch repair protein)